MPFDLTTKKRRHHYVWQHYLRAWADAESMLYATDSNTIFRVKTSNVAVERDFYRLKELTTQDIVFVDSTCIQGAPAGIQPTLRGWVSVFNGLGAVREALAKIGIDVDNAKGGEIFDIAANNAEEEIHATIEANAIPYLDALRTADMRFLEDDDSMSEFLHFLCVQYMRTRNRKRKMLERFRGVDIGAASIERCWGLISHVLATNIAYNMVGRRGEMDILLIRAPTGSTFITGDQPVVNAKAVELPEHEIAEELLLIYPLTPKLALLLDADSKRGMRGIRDVSADDVTRYNGLLMAGIDRFAFAASRSELENFANAQA